MAKLIISRDGIDFNQGGRYLTFFWRWRNNGIVRLWISGCLNGGGKRGFVLFSGFGHFSCGKVRN